MAAVGIFSTIQKSKVRPPGRLSVTYAPRPALLTEAWLLLFVPAVVRRSPPPPHSKKSRPRAQFLFRHDEAGAAFFWHPSCSHPYHRPAHGAWGASDPSGAKITVRVTTMESELEFAIQASTTGKQLFDQVRGW